MRAFGRFTLQRLLGKSDATMTWLAVDNATSAEAMLSMPRVPPVGAADLAQWLYAARRASRLDHPTQQTSHHSLTRTRHSLTCWLGSH